MTVLFDDCYLRLWPSPVLRCLFGIIFVFFTGLIVCAFAIAVAMLAKCLSLRVNLLCVVVV